MMYVPPFTISANAINLIAEISARIERYAIRLEQNDKLRLRKANRVRTIHSSLAIEGNTLSEDEVKDIIDGKTVVASLRQIQEVKNAIKTYELYSGLNPFNVKDLLKAHGTMMMALTDDAGKFRSGGAGVFSEKAWFTWLLLQIEYQNLLRIYLNGLSKLRIIYSSVAAYSITNLSLFIRSVMEMDAQVVFGNHLFWDDSTPFLSTCL